MDMFPSDLPDAVAIASVVLSIAVLVGTALLVPWLLARIPADYFVRPAEVLPDRPLLRALRVLLGSVLVLLGVVMLLLPGQGVLAILAGISLLPFRGKRKLELWILRKGPVRRVTQALRKRAGKPPLELDSAAPKKREASRPPGTPDAAH